MGYKFFEHTADIGIEANSKSLNELFCDCALALFDLTSNTSKIKGKDIKKIEIKADNLENLLYDFLSEIIYIRDVDSMIFKNTKIKVNEEKFSLIAELSGDIINKNHELLRDVKAVTKHDFLIEENNGWKARIILDI